MLFVSFLFIIIQERLIKSQKIDCSHSSIYCVGLEYQYQTIQSAIDSVHEGGDKIYLSESPIAIGNYKIERIELSNIKHIPHGYENQYIEILPFPNHQVVIEQVCQDVHNIEMIYISHLRYWHIHNGDGELIIETCKETYGNLNFIFNLQNTEDIKITGLKIKEQLNDKEISVINIQDSYKISIEKVIFQYDDDKNTKPNYNSFSNTIKTIDVEEINIFDCQFINVPYCALKLRRTEQIWIERNYFLPIFYDQEKNRLMFFNAYNEVNILLYFRNNIIDYSITPNSVVISWEKQEATFSNYRYVYIQNNLFFCNNYTANNYHLFEFYLEREIGRFLYFYLYNNMFVGECVSGTNPLINVTAEDPESLIDDVLLNSYFYNNIYDYPPYTIINDQSGLFINNNEIGSVDLHGRGTRPLPYFRVTSPNQGVTYGGMTPIIDFDGKIRSSPVNKGPFEFISPPCIGNWDDDNDCITCKSNYTNKYHDNCGSCLGNRDLLTGCKTCKNHWSNENNDDCKTCSGGWDKSSDCNICKNRWIEDDGLCSICFGNFNSTNDCLTCRNSWKGKNCTECFGNWDSNGDCGVCRTHWINGEDQLCEICSGNWDSDKDCDKCLPNYKGDDCEIEIILKTNPGATLLIVYISSGILIIMLILLTLMIFCICVFVVIKNVKKLKAEKVKTKKYEMVKNKIRYSQLKDET